MVTLVVSCVDLGRCLPSLDAAGRPGACYGLAPRGLGPGSEVRRSGLMDAPVAGWVFVVRVLRFFGCGFGVVRLARGRRKVGTREFMRQDVCSQWLALCRCGVASYPRRVSGIGLGRGGTHWYWYSARTPVCQFWLFEHYLSGARFAMDARLLGSQWLFARAFMPVVRSARLQFSTGNSIGLALMGSSLWCGSLVRE